MSRYREAPGVRRDFHNTAFREFESFGFGTAAETMVSGGSDLVHAASEVSLNGFDSGPVTLFELSADGQSNNGAVSVETPYSHIAAQIPSLESTTKPVEIKVSKGKARRQARLAALVRLVKDVTQPVGLAPRRIAGDGQGRRKITVRY